MRQVNCREIIPDSNRKLTNVFLLRGRSLTTLTRRGRYLGGTGNINGMQIFPYNSKGIPSQMSTWGRYYRWSKRPKSCKRS